MPESEDFKRGCVRTTEPATKLSKESKSADTVGRSVRSVRMAHAIVPAADYPELLKLESILGRKGAKTVLLESSPTPLP